jgi:hypothetical protein
MFSQKLEDFDGRGPLDSQCFNQNWTIIMALCFVVICGSNQDRTFNVYFGIEHYAATLAASLLFNRKSVPL